MTLLRENAEIFNVTAEEIASIIHSTLEEGQPSYKYTAIEREDKLAVWAVIKPNLWPLILSTKLTIQVLPEGSQSKVVVQTRSQWFILADVFGLYDGYIADFLRELRQEVVKSANQRLKTDAEDGAA